jgi:two-component system cell cycle sensor histidine kinase/response regulator CckA
LKFDPGVKAIVASGYVDDPVMNDHTAYGFSGAISKPCLLDELAKMLAIVLPE